MTDLRNCDALSPNDKNGLCIHSGGACRCTGDPGHVGDHGCYCGDTWPGTPQPAQLYLRLDPTQWALISTYHDSPTITGAWGPFPTEEAAHAAQAALLDAGIDLHHCTIEPIRQVVNQP